MEQKTITVIIPVIGNPPYLKECLKSIRNQVYPQDKVEIIIAEATSTRDCFNLFMDYKAQVLGNPYKTAEKGKELALCKANGDYICFLDSDNVLLNPLYFTQAIQFLKYYEHGLGVEAGYLPASDMSSLCKYLTTLLPISDPISNAIARRPFLHGPYKDYGQIYSRNNMGYPLGANGFIFRKSDLLKIDANKNFEDTEVANRIDKHIWIKIPAVAHYYINSIFHFLCKRRRQTYHYLSRKKQYNHWAAFSRMQIFWILLAHVSFIIPLIATYQMWKEHRKWYCLWHPIASFVSVLGIAWGYLTYKLGYKQEHKLQPK